MSELNLVLLGPPGAGKGTQAARLAEDFGLQYIATGNMLRERVREGTELGQKAKEYMDRGDLVPDDLIIAMIKESLEQDDRANGFILDGFPRTERQAEALDEELEHLGRTLNAALLIDVDEQDVVRPALAAARVRQGPAQLPRRLRPAQASRTAATSTAAAWCSATTTSRR